MPSVSNIREKEMRRVVKMIIAMQTVFLVLILPRDLFLVSFSLSWLDNDGIKYGDVVRYVNEFLKLLQTSNCCANIFIYAKLHDHFRKVVKIIPAKKKSIYYFLHDKVDKVMSKKRYVSTTNKPDGVLIHGMGRKRYVNTLNEAEGWLLQGEYSKRILSIIYNLDESDV